MNLASLISIKVRSKKRVGRGAGSGKGKTATRGTKGQKARGSVPLGFGGSTLPLYKQLPYRRGLGNPKKSRDLLPLPVETLSRLKAGTEVNLELLVKENLIRPRDLQKSGVKLVGTFALTNKLIIKLPVSKSARASIEAAGGRVE